MKSIKWTLFLASFALVASFSMRSLAQDEEPIPDFGPSGPAGIEKRGLRGGGLPPAGVDQRDLSMMQRRAQLQMPNIRQALQRMNLSDEQRKKIRSIFVQFADDGKAIRADLATSRESLKAAQESKPRDPAAIKAAKEDVDSHMKKMGVLQAQVRTSVLNVLSIEQEEDLYRRVEIMRKREEGRASNKEKPLP